MAHKGLRATVVAAALLTLPLNVLPLPALDAQPKVPSLTNQIAEDALRRYDEAMTRAVKTAIREAYQCEFGEVVPIPAIFNDERSVDCKGNGHLTTTAYLKKGEHSVALLQMFLSRDGKQVLRRSMSYPRAPFGSFKTLVVIVRYAETVSKHKGVSPDDYRPVILIDLNPDRVAGGLAHPGGDVYMGNYGRWTAPLGEREWGSVARAVYHQEDQP